MYPCYGQESQILRINGELMGVSFGSDTTTEHECGVGPIWKQFGIAKHSRSSLVRTDYQKWKAERDDMTLKARLRRFFRRETPLPAMGLDKRRITVVPQFFNWVEKDGFAGFCLFFRSFAIDSVVTKFTKYFVRDRDLVCGWSDENFIALGKSPETIKALRDIFDAVQRKDAVFGSFDGIEHRGPALLIASMVPPAVDEALFDKDMLRFEMDRLVDESGIVDEVKKAGKRTFSLHEGIVGKDGVLRIWLNPYEQDRDNSGWFTVDELRQWCNDEGPVVKKGRDRR